MRDKLYQSTSSGGKIYGMNRDGSELETAVNASECKSTFILPQHLIHEPTQNRGFTISDGGIEDWTFDCVMGNIYFATRSMGYIRGVKLKIR